MPSPVPDLAPLTPGARRVLDAASRLFYDRGIHAVGVDTIAEVAGVTKKTLYDRFGSKETLVVSYLQHRDARWRDDLAARLAAEEQPGIPRILAVFDHALAWSTANSPKGCSAVNARAEVGGDEGAPVLAEVSREKTWLLDLFAELCEEGGIDDPRGTAETLMLLYEGAIVTLGMGTFAEPFTTARRCAEGVLTARTR
ncbi:TetR/AcrR family transcriptional regulator [Microbacterium sp. 1.5R]|uniref:TetR/AcrR family transcriptional regulator n=1 Tax=Microbacterium sp. 1.5R TaxID=1916917 RepID=UPI0011A052D1|nr:TetR/AcrR family transcriptional regulator [Microbacterium sp. 1.5R]